MLSTNVMMGKSKGVAQNNLLAICGIYLGDNKNLVFLNSDLTVHSSYTFGTASNLVTTISDDENYLYIGGQFTGTNQTRFAIIRKSDWQLMTFAGFNATVYKIINDENYIYVVGNFTGTNMNRFAIIRKSDFTLVSHNLSFSTFGYGLAQDDEYVYYGGGFAGTNMNGLAIIRKSDFTLVSYNYPYSNLINNVAVDEQYIYTAGQSITIDSISYRGWLARINKIDYTTEYRNITGGDAFDLSLFGDDIFVASKQVGTVVKLAGKTTNDFAGILSTITLDSGSATQLRTVYQYGNNLFYGGDASTSTTHMMYKVGTDLTYLSQHILKQSTLSKIYQITSVNL